MLIPENPRPPHPRRNSPKSPGIAGRPARARSSARRLSSGYCSAYLPRHLPLHVYPDYPMPADPIKELHFHPLLEIGICKSGSGIFMIGDDILPFKAGDISIISEGVVHYARSAEEGCKWTWIHCRPDLLLQPVPGTSRYGRPETYRGFAGLYRDGMAAPVLGGRGAPGPGVLRHCLEQVLEEAEQKHLSRLALAAAWLLFWRNVERSGPLEPRSADATLFEGMEAVFPALLKLNQALHPGAGPAANGGEGSADDGTDNETLARLCGMSSRHFVRLFRRSVGQTPASYRVERRLQQAARLLKEGAKVAEAARCCGFSVSTLDRQFRDKFGASPLEWKKLPPQAGRPR